MAFEFGLLRVPLRMTLTNEGTTPAQAIFYGHDGQTHPHDNAELESYWRKALRAAEEQAGAGNGVAVFPKKEASFNVDLIFHPRLISTDADGQFTITFGAVVTYAWDGSKNGKTMVTAMLRYDGDDSPYPDGWRFNLTALKNCQSISL